MFKRSCTWSSYQRGGWSPGSKHQKHMSMNPTLFLYRFPGPRGPGPYTMKYWWTLGCFPSGIQVPFRLHEFLATYQQEHVPIEVEEWLHCFVKDPVQSLEEAVDDLFLEMENMPALEEAKGYSMNEHSVKKLLKPLKKFEEQLGIHVPASGVRSALGSAKLREKVLDDLYDYKEAIKANGSTPHRRYAKENMELLDLQSSDKPLLEDNSNKGQISETLGKTVGAIMSPPLDTAKDERKLIQLLTSFAEGCVRKENHADAFSLLSSSLAFAHDDETRSIVHANVAASAILDGQFKEGEYHGRESALLATAAQKTTSGSRGYALWATAVAYQDDFERAERIIDDALEIYTGDQQLLQAKEQIKTAMTANKHMSPSLRGSRMPLKSQQARGLYQGSGRLFDNEFDWAVFKNKLYPSKMDPRTNEMGSVFRRVGDLGGHISTSRSTEIL
ncbi:hypothetical protein STCU_02565 [Strigomonas culicis]|uniref:Uncharacterized protein n=1 Tax=Strigomonas culicis TaxID=28005 RepID=S9U9H8_9TRYP|nr:hypothetical protein STCU_07962 [Strigomonas culicis]EPY25573.1 hypothetical protein STCU_06670 [Strigomonas culicis]EPY32947.1 hypothetical protein STCU_02565 [Strigomonas culicis]|eukprot:EPY22997.1 hypothetical protein STCU_07962 [Strigomonas culicis]